ncbi:RNA polymerase sigma factor [Flexithrix dorotheae]|uniref:RNA polymerase sigma factor n=1 Tax=Flexithrix dorotheae TaxID=70993 RepID=UPI00036BB101|nr:RNA polymerase sigma factor [Flexithrix dorotheae]
MDVSKTEDVDLLLNNFQKGDRISFEKIYKFYHPILFNYGRQFGLSETIVDDCIQDIFIEIWNSRERLKINALKFYLIKCLRNRITKYLSKNLREKEKAEKYWKEEFEISYDPAILGLQAQNKSELESRLINNIKQLSPKQREIIFLIFYNNLSYSEAAEVLNIKIKTVYNQVHNSINSLREALISLLIFWAFYLSLN